MAELSTRLERLVIAPPTAVPAAAGRRQSKAKRLPGGVALGPVGNLFTCAIDVSKLSTVRTVVAALVSSLRSSSSTAGAGGIGGLGGGGSCKLPFKPKRYTFHAERPNWKSDIRWVSADDEHTFGLFQALFDKLGLAAAFSFLGQMTLFSGFLVIRQCTRKSHFHTDFGDTGGKAFTLMTPLDDMADLDACHLLAKLPRSGGDGSSSSCVDGGGDGGGGGGSSGASAAHGAAGDEGEDASGASGTDRPCDVRQYRYEFGRGICFGDGFVHATETGDSP
ncbi:hypothetical protein T484DRAFT_1877560, partial [Baffinella frigidus]